MYGRIIPVGEINTRKAAAKVEYTTFIARGNDLWVKWRFCCAYLYSFRIETRGENETKFSYLHLKFIVESIIYSILDFKLFLGKFFNFVFLFPLSKDSFLLIFLYTKYKILFYFIIKLYNNNKSLNKSRSSAEYELRERVWTNVRKVGSNRC